MNLRTMLGGLPPWIVTLPLILGLLFLGLGLRMLIRSRHWRRTWTRRAGQVVGSRLSDGQIQSQVTFVDEQGQVTFWNRDTTSFASDPVGRRVEVLVNPEDRSDALVTAGLAAPGFVADAFIVFGVLATAVGVTMLVAVRR